jgi:hypothetical protein
MKEPIRVPGAPPDRSRPDLFECTSSAEFRNWYYLRSELAAFAKASGLSTAGSKLDISTRIERHLDGKSPLPETTRRPGAGAGWARAQLTRATMITSTISFGPNFRRFMRQEIGDRFVCSSDFMDWCKSHSGKTLDDAIAAWHLLDSRRSQPAFRTYIRPGNQYNQFTRDFMRDNPGASLADCRRVWKLKRARPGSVAYSREDRKLI